MREHVCCIVILLAAMALLCGCGVESAQPTTSAPDANGVAAPKEGFFETVNPASPRIHYVLHHVFQPYKNRLPEWEANTTAENAKWLIEHVQPKLKWNEKGKN